MTPIIYINPMPESCGKCQLMYSTDTGHELSGCKGVWRTDEFGDDEAGLYEGFNPEIMRHKDCPLNPLVLCGECMKRDTDECLRKRYSMIFYDWTDFDPDDFCKDGVKA